MLMQLAHSIQQQWPLRELGGTQSPFELKIYYSLVQMGYQAVPSYDSEDGLHFIDIALLPQKQLPCKIAVEADGGTHFLYEDYRLGNAPQPATRYEAGSCVLLLLLFLLLRHEESFIYHGGDGIMDLTRSLTADLAV